MENVLKTGQSLRLLYRLLLLRLLVFQSKQNLLHNFRAVLTQSLAQVINFIDEFPQVGAALIDAELMH